MFNSNMLNILSSVALLAALAAAFVLAWELQNRRTLPPIRVERANHPRWYWLCILTHAVLLLVVVLVCGALALTSFFNNFFN